MPLDASTPPHGPDRKALHRLSDWDRRLLEYLNLRRDVPYIWGANDAISFGLGAVHAVTGVHIWPVTWNSQEQARRAVEAEGGLNVALDRILGASQSRPTSVRRGDLVFVGKGMVGVLGVSTGETLVLPSRDGLTVMPIDDWTLLSWEVG